MQVYFAGIQEVSSIDYPGKLCSVVFFQGCNLRCRFCYNADQLGFTNKKPLNHIFSEITKNLQVINSVMLSGGEPLIHEEAILKIREWCNNHDLKLGAETNGTFPTRLQRLMELKAFDFIAMDVKSAFNEDDYEKVTGCRRMFPQYMKSFRLLKNSRVPHEFRLTVTPALHSIENIMAINEEVKPSKLVLQRFQAGEKVMDKTLNNVFFPSHFEKRLKMWSSRQKNTEMRFWN
ncbi:anaerobic ribonucleoside-triphosphate reductase activating protein [archaeon CG07_land_8_20_14_0_80_38_8]|nr:MAG: anaerobic ribonucleoside-triphosphate reductase activating protein [archaeon CG07_land_8_20_14_0_80_38_8]PIU89579.1 MAG: anaerobic ribonucleoside-triphosphate reductase activating protein [archaeon CG06_land_8_20_14_3_00_37_11]